MATKDKKTLHGYKVEFRVYGRYVDEETHIVAYSPKQAKKFFYDWWKNHHTNYAVVILVSQIEDNYAKELAERTTGETLEERFKTQCDHIYRRENNG